MNIDFELQKTDLELLDVVISVPLPPGSGAPVVGEVDGEFRFNRKAGAIEWMLPVVNKDTPGGSMDFTTEASSADEFFPVEAAFRSTKTLAAVEVARAELGTGGESTFSSSSVFRTTKYSIV